MPCSANNCELKQDIIEIKQALTDLNHSLNGNGQPGLKTRIALIESFQSTLKKFAWIIITSVVGTCLSAVVLGITAVIKLWHTVNS